MASDLLLAQAFVQRHPEAAVRALEGVDADAGAALLAALPSDNAASVLRTMLPDAAADCLQRLEPGRAAELLRPLPPTQAASLLRRPDLQERERLLTRLTPAQRLRVDLLLRQPRQTIGAWMDTRVVSVRANSTVGNALRRLGRHRGLVTRLFVVDAEQHLRGVVELRDLLGAPHRYEIGQIAQPAPNALRANATLRAALDMDDWNEFDSMPVVDAERRLVGVLRYADLRRISHDSVVDAGPGTGDDAMDLASSCYLGMADVMSAMLGRTSTKARK